MLNARTIAKVALSMGVVALVAGCGGKPSRMQRALSEKDEYIRKQQNQLAEAQKREETLTAQNDELLRQKQQVMTQNTKLAGNLNTALKRNAQLGVQTQAEVKSLRGQIAALEKKLGSQKGGDVTVRADEMGAITIRVANTVLFDLGKATLKSSSHAKLNKIAKTLKADYPKNFIRVEGHTDSSPVIRNKHKFADNMVLSQARAKAVYDHLVRSSKMPASRMYTAGYSYYQPLVWPEKTRADRAKNRRVDIVILPNIKVSKERLTAKK